MHDVHKFVVNNCIYAGLNLLCLVARETNFSFSFTSRLAISGRYADQLNSWFVVTQI